MFEFDAPSGTGSTGSTETNGIPKLLTFLSKPCSAA
jgi:hypothetical protein